MKTIGIIGGLSPQSTILYYEALNRQVQQRLGGHHNAKILLSSVDFGAFVALKEAGDWATQGRLLAHEAAALERAGANFIILATNTMHKLADDITKAITIPFLHIGAVTANHILQDNKNKVGLLGTRYTMELDFYKQALADKDIDAIIPDPQGIEDVNRIIYDELCHGIISAESRARYVAIIEALKREGAQGVILGCTEITMLVKQTDTDLKLFDTSQIHIDAAVDFAFGQNV